MRRSNPPLERVGESGGFVWPDPAPFQLHQGSRFANVAHPGPLFLFLLLVSHIFSFLTVQKIHSFQLNFVLPLKN